jgi:cytoskeletal protein CcmA (bactofilin family)
MQTRSDLSVPMAYTPVAGVLEAGCEFEGKLCFQGTFRIGGRFKGEIFTPDTLVISDGAHVEGKIEAGIVIISGEVNATVRAKQRVEIRAPGVFRGDLLTPSLSIDEGVLFEGSSKMGHPAS